MRRWSRSCENIYEPIETSSLDISIRSEDCRIQRKSEFHLEDPTGPPDRSFKVIFIGDSSVGKSSFVVRLTKNTFIPSLSSTLGVDFQVKSARINGVNVALQLWDTAGQERFRCITKTYYRKVDGIMCLYDVSSESSFLNVRQWVSDIESQVCEPIPLVLIANKSDLRDFAPLDKNQSFVMPQQGFKLAQVRPYF